MTYHRTRKRRQPASRSRRRGVEGRGPRSTRARRRAPRGERFTTGNGEVAPGRVVARGAARAEASALAPQKPKAAGPAYAAQNVLACHLPRPARAKTWRGRDGRRRRFMGRRRRFVGWAAASVLRRALTASRGVLLECVAPPLAGPRARGDDARGVCARRRAVSARGHGKRPAVASPHAERRGWPG